MGYLQKQTGVRAIFAERQDGALTLRRGFTLGPEDRLVVIEDVVTTGGSTRETMDVAAAHGAAVVAAGSIIDRSGGSATLGVPYHALVSLSLPTWQESECPTSVTCLIPRWSRRSRSVAACALSE